MNAVLWALRFSGMSFVIGLILSVWGSYLWWSYEPLPDDLPFSSPVDYGLVFLFFAVVGAVLVIRALLEGERMRNPVRSDDSLDS